MYRFDEQGLLYVLKLNLTLHIQLDIHILFAIAWLANHGKKLFLRK